MTFLPTPQQNALRHAIETQAGSLELSAKAGSGKTTTLVWATQFMTGSVALLAFNKKIATELQSRITDSRITAGTFHSFGYKCWRSVAPKCRLDEKKMDQIVPDQYHYDPALRRAMLKLISLAKQHLLTPESPHADWQHLIEHYALETEQELVPDIAFARQYLATSIAQCAMRVDFDDMIYAPVSQHVGCGRYDWVLIDEAQDTNAARRGLALQMLRPGGRLIAVGDEHQSIYGFTGADSDAMALIEAALALVLGIKR